MDDNDTNEIVTKLERRSCESTATRNVLAALRAEGYAVVRLPETSIYDDDERGEVIHYVGYSECYYPQTDGSITNDSHGKTWPTAADAAEDAAALLAASIHISHPAGTDDVHEQRGTEVDRLKQPR